MSGIIVGVEESEHAREALRWALREAALRQVALTVMTVRPGEVRPATMIFWGLRPTADGGSDDDLLQGSVRELVDKVGSEIGGTPPAVTITVATGHPAEQLAAASRDADMLVVGSRGGGGFGGLMLGSVTSQVLHHAACPVVVVPPAVVR